MLSTCRYPPSPRRSILFVALASLGLHSLRSFAQPPLHPNARWFDAAEAMRKLALSWGDQGYGAVVIIGESVIGEGPSRVVRDQDPDAHAERVAIRDAQRKLGRSDLSGAVLYSTSRPCPACEQAAAIARVQRMYVGSGMADAGSPKAGESGR